MKILNDTEHRIFLCAMAREIKICKKIDADKVNDGTVRLLVPVCKSIERKVNSAVPMETIDQMIAELEKLKMTSGITNQSTWNECLHYCLKTVNEYCKGVPGESNN